MPSAWTEVKRQPFKNSCTPISYGDAQPLLEALGGPVVPENGGGHWPITITLDPDR